MLDLHGMKLCIRAQYPWKAEDWYMLQFKEGITLTAKQQIYNVFIAVRK